MKCDRCRKETGKRAEKHVAVGFNPTTGKEMLIPYTLPLYCDECKEDLKALNADMTALALLRLGSIAVGWHGERRAEVSSQ
jgi:hypothetical protein